MSIFKRTGCLILVLCALLTCAPAAFAEEELSRATPTDITFERPPATPTDTPDASGEEELPKATPTDISFERPPVTPTDTPKPATPTNAPSGGKPHVTPTDIPKKPSNKPGNKPGDKPGAPWEHEPATPTDYPSPDVLPASPDEIQPEKTDLGSFFMRIIKAIVEAIKKFFTSLFGIK